MQDADLEVRAEVLALSVEGPVQCGTRGIRCRTLVDFAGTEQLRDGSVGREEDGGVEAVAEGLELHLAGPDAQVVPLVLGRRREHHRAVAYEHEAPLLPLDRRKQVGRTV